MAEAVPRLAAALIHSHRRLCRRLKAGFDGAGIIVQRMILATGDIGDARYRAPPPTRSLFNRWSPMG